jgi:alkanesulfonate monooxygenase SsuD/methylene tetrahydromethanopterin reductase-like flavin-dependent oxidoreductase (luciferase family)
MRFHIFCIPVIPDVDIDPRASYASLVRQAHKAEEAGFDGFWIAEHHFSRYGGLIPSAGVMLAYLAAHTATIRLGVAVAVLPLRDPIATAEEFSMVDALSEGRLELGVGRGFVSAEFIGKGVPFDERQSRFITGLSLIEDHLGGKHVPDRTRRNGRDPQIVPRATQSGVPIWIAVSTNLDSCVLAGVAGHGLLLNPYNRHESEVDEAIATYLKAWRDTGGHTRNPRILVNQLLYAAPTAQEAKAGARDALNSYLYTAQQAFQVKSYLNTPLPPGHQFDDLYPDKLLFGTPDWISATIESWAERGVTDVALMTHFGDPPAADADRSLDLFATQVMARFRRNGRE